MIIMDDRCDTGISELDSALSGGIPRGNLVLLSGGAGTGKSTLCLHFLIAGAKKGEHSVYISTEQNQDELIKQASCYMMPFKELIESGIIKVVMIDVLRNESVIEKLQQEVHTVSPSRIVIDSLSTFSEFASSIDFAREILLRQGGVAARALDQVSPLRISERTMTKRMLGMLVRNLRAMNATALMTSELPERGDVLSSDGITEFLADGVITIESISGFGKGGLRNIRIRKMRYTKHTTESLPFEITSKGITVEYSGG